MVYGGSSDFTLEQDTLIQEKAEVFRKLLLELTTLRSQTVLDRSYLVTRSNIDLIRVNVFRDLNNPDDFELAFSLPGGPNDSVLSWPLENGHSIALERVAPTLNGVRRIDTSIIATTENGSLTGYTILPLPFTDTIPSFGGVELGWHNTFWVERLKDSGRLVRRLDAEDTWRFSMDAAVSYEKAYQPDGSKTALPLSFGFTDIYFAHLAKQGIVFTRLEQNPARPPVEEIFGKGLLRMGVIRWNELHPSDQVTEDRFLELIDRGEAILPVVVFLPNLVDGVENVGPALSREKTTQTVPWDIRKGVRFVGTTQIFGQATNLNVDCFPYLGNHGELVIVHNGVSNSPYPDDATHMAYTLIFQSRCASALQAVLKTNQEEIVRNGFGYWMQTYKSLSMADPWYEVFGATAYATIAPGNFRFFTDEYMKTFDPKDLNDPTKNSPHLFLR